MNKGLKRLLFLVSLMMIGIFLSACTEEAAKEDASVNDSGAAMDDYKVGDTFKANESMTLSMLYSDHPNYPIQEDWLLFEEIKKRTNVSFDTTVVPMSDYEQKRSLLISSGDSPLIIPKTYPGQETPFVASGAILPVSDYVKYMPHFQAAVEKWDMKPYLDGLRQKDGKYYLLPGMHENVWPDYTLAIRTDILKELNLEVPKTWEELEVVLTKMKEAYPDVTPISDRFKLESTLNIAATSFGTRAGWGLGTGLKFDPKEENWYFAPATDAHKEMVTYFHGLVEKGLLDKESVTQEDDQAVQKLINGESFVINTNSQNIVSYRSDMKETLGEGNFSISKIPVPGGPVGQVMAGTKLENGIMISSKAKDNPNFKAILQFIDWLWYSPEGKELTKWGVEGVTYTKAEEGTRKLAEDVNYVGLNPSGTKKLNADFGFSGGVFSYGGSTELLHSMMSEEEIKFQNAMAETKEVLIPDPPIKYDQMQLEKQNLLKTPLLDHVKQNTLQFILGSRDLSEWDAYVEELKAKGMADYVDLANKVYDEQNK